jgi:type II secretory pathway pseudopilin PulG
MSLVEVIVVIGVIALLMAILLPGLALARRNANFAKSQNNLSQIYKYLIGYAGDNRDVLVPAAFDYSAQGLAGDPRVQVRAPSPPGQFPPLGDPYKGSWSDILWTVNKLGPLNPTGDAGSYDYRFDSPDRAFYDLDPDDSSNVFRSATRMTKVVDGTGAFPFGTGSQSSERDQPGYFAANHFFDLTSNGGKWFTTGQIVRPMSSMYLVDSYGGEVTVQSGSSVDTFQLDYVDFRYPGEVCIMLMLDGHVESPVQAWESLRDLEESRQVRVLDLDRQRSFWAP